MYNLKYVSDNGKTINFSPLEKLVITNAEGLTSNSVSIATSQGIGQVGTSVQGKSTDDKLITLEGEILGESTALRKQLIDTIVPLVSGTLIFDNELYIVVEPEETPDISRHKHNARFQFILRAPYPYWRALAQSSISLSGLKKMFKFPVNYAEQHIFAIRMEDVYQTIYNEGNVPIPFMVRFFAKTPLSNPQIENIKTLEFIRMKKDMVAGETITVDMTGNTLRITTNEGGTEANAFGYFDIDSTLFKLEVGENSIKSSAEVNKDGLYCTIFYHLTTAGAYGTDNVFV